jgi:ABC-type Fe3+-hydroxamate transport system substrate-binding protein
VDARGRELVLRGPPSRIVSLVPSQTELLADLGLDREVVGRTRFCVHPRTWCETKRNVGGTKDIRLDRVRELRPDLILANLEENRREDVERLEQLAPVYVTEVRNLSKALAMIRSVAWLTGREDVGESLALRIERGFAELPGFPPVPTLYLIWRAPFMTVGGDTFIHDVLRRGGLVNVFGSRQRYPELSPEDIAAAGAQWVVLPSEPYPFRERHVDELCRILPGARVRLVDGALLSWYGSRLARTPAYLRHLRAERDELEA